MKDTEIILKFAEDLLSGNHLPVCRMTLPCPDAARFDQGLRQDILHISDLENTVNQFLEELKPEKLYFIRDDYLCSYIFLRLPDSDEIFSCGPVVYEQIQGDRLKRLLKELDIPEKLSGLFRDYYLNVSYVATPLFLTNLFTLLARRLFGEDGYEIVETTFQELSQWSDFYQNYFRVEETPFLSIQMIESRYQAEGELISAVQKGNEKKALDLLTRQASHIIPERLTSHLRDQMDYCITLNTLLRKAAEIAGVHPIHIDSLSNQNVKTIETLSSIEQCAAFQRECVQNYCRLVRRYTLGNYSSLTQKVLTYISTDLSADLSLKNFSDLLSVNASYLSTLFKKEVGVPLTEYVNRSRIRHAQALLLGTDLPIKTIAQQCGIADIYYFSRLFKRITGTTPKAFRESKNTAKYQAALGTSPDKGPCA
ncbi:MAG: helix-turn-helix domain-containing protein [Clostridiales bacterium]|nr:helix-turn-helix domain-containing protein [Clostridiales bacterium]